MKTKHYLLALALPALLLHSAWAASFNTSITYQGRLNDPKGPANGLYDFQFYAYTSENGYSGYVVDTNGVAVSNGLFTVLLDFGPGVFTGEERWLQIWVRSNSVAVPPDMPEPFTKLAPRQPLTATPFAHFAASAGSVPSASITGVNLASNSVTASKIAPGQVVKTLNGLTDAVAISAGTNVNIHAGVENDLIISAAPGSVVTNAGWGLAGNPGTVPGMNFVGTTDGQPLELRAGNQRALRLEYNSGSPNVIGGSSANSAGTLVQGGTIGGGTGNTFPNSSVPTMQPTIGGGSGNTIEGWAYHATIGGGSGNRIQYDGDDTVIAGGNGNLIGTNADFSVIGGGQNNLIANAVSYGMIPGGYNNSVAATGSLAAGRNAHITGGHTGNFLWNDGTSDVYSSAANRFEVFASGGAFFNCGATFATGTSSVPGISASSSLGYGGVFSGKIGARILGTDGGLYAQSFNGYAGEFSGNVKVIVRYDSAPDKPQLELWDSADTGVSRLRLSLGSGPLFWDIASRTDGGSNALRFYNSAVADDVMTLQTDGTLSVKALSLSGGASLSGTATPGTISLAPPTVLNFGNGTRQMLNLYDTEYAIGVQNYAEYFRSSSDFYWFKGGTHSNTTGDAGTNGASLMHLDSTGTLFVKVLTVQGADVAEPFQMSSPALAQGSVVVIDEDHPGQLKQSTSAYDTRVAGIISGAGGVRPGLSLQQLASEKDGQNVALTGRVYVQAEAANGAIRPGDLLTTSSTPGHAMKVTDHARAQGAILGKAMMGLKEGKGLILVLVTLQ